MTKTTIRGVPPVFDQHHLEQLRDRKIQAFLNTTQSKHLIHAALPAELLKLYGELVKEGYTLSDLPVTMAPGVYSAWLIKPAHILDPEIEAIKAKAKVEYVTRLESEHDRYKQLLIQQLIEADEKKEAQEAARRKEKKLAEFRKQADECYKPLEIPE